MRAVGVRLADVKVEVKGEVEVVEGRRLREEVEGGG